MVKITVISRIRHCIRLFPAAFLFVVCSGCGKHFIGPDLNYIIPTAAATKIELLHCDRVSPPNCKHAKITYAKGAEQVETPKKK